MERENNNLEYKETINKSYLKTVSAFSNYNDGEIIFGVSDTYEIVAIDNLKDACLKIENQINDSIKPKPNYTLKINDNNTITLFVIKGYDTPYRYNGKAYKRNDSSTIEVDDLEERRLVLNGMNISFEEIITEKEDLDFTYLETKLRETINLENFNLDILKSLDLYKSNKGFNNAARLVADTNDFPGLDIAIFGNSINIFKKRITLSGESIIKQYFDSLEIFRNEYEIEIVEKGIRKKVELIPFEAFREAVANSLVHRVWDVNANTKIEMHPDRIVVSSPGGLIADMSVEDYVNGNYSILRNPTIANVFRRLNIIEAFATGIKRIKESYGSTIVKPIFNVTNTAISVTLPVINKNVLNENENIVFSSMKENYKYTRQELEKISGFAKDTLIRTLNSLIEKGLVKKEGKGRATYYTLI